MRRGYRSPSEKTSVDPNTGEMITPQEFVRRGLAPQEDTHFMELHRRWEAREPATPASAKVAYVVRDIEPYRSVASDVANGGKTTVIGGRRQHREFLKRNGYFEIGNERTTPTRELLPRNDRIADIKRALGEG